jgi:hypothetical protein
MYELKNWLLGFLDKLCTWTHWLDRFFLWIFFSISENGLGYSHCGVAQLAFWIDERWQPHPAGRDCTLSGTFFTEDNPNYMNETPILPSCTSSTASDSTTTITINGISTTMSGTLVKLVDESMYKKLFWRFYWKVK